MTKASFAFLFCGVGFIAACQGEVDEGEEVEVGSDSAEQLSAAAGLEIIDVNAEGLPADRGGSLGGGSAISSADGSRILFFSTSAQFGDNPWQRDYLFVRDRTTGLTRRVVPEYPPDAYGEMTRAPAISADGRFVSFVTRMTLSEEDQSPMEDVYITELETGRIELVSIGDAGQQGTTTTASEKTAVSADGRWVVFSTRAQLDPEDTDQASDVYIRDRVAHTTRLVSATAPGRSRNYLAPVSRVVDFSLAPSGRCVAFTWPTGSVVTTEWNYHDDVFLRDVAQGTTERVSLTNGSRISTGWNRAPSVSDDCNRITFLSASTDHVSGDTNGKIDAFFRDRSRRITRRVGVASNGAQPSDDILAASISNDGTRVMFRTAARLTLRDTDDHQDVYLRSITSSQTIRVSQNDDGSSFDSATYGAQLAPDGRAVIFGNASRSLAGSPASTPLVQHVYRKVVP